MYKNPKKFKKTLGQNFLKNTSIAEYIARAGDISPNETVLEIGPGKGILTGALLSLGARVIAVEKDRELVELLKEKLAEEIKGGKLRVIHGDALKFGETSYQSPVTSYKLVANIPYYITGAILKHFLSLKHPPSLMALMVQKEVAERIVAKNKKESLLSLSVKAYGKPKILKIVKAGSFAPAPKVDSAVLKIENISRRNFRKISEKKFFKILKAGFAHKRKKLSGNLTEAGFPKEIIEGAFAVCGIQKNARAENVSLEQWKMLTELL